MGREPRSQQRAVALAGIDVNLFISVFTVTVDDVLAVERVVVIQWFVGPKSVSIDGQRLLLVVVEQESHSRFVGGFRRDHVTIVRSTVNKREHWWFVTRVRATPTRGEATRARLLIALAAFASSRNVHFVDFNRASQCDRGRVERSGELLDALSQRSVGQIEFSLNLANTRVEPYEGVDREVPLFEF